METDEIKQLKMEGIIDEVEDDIKENFIYNNKPTSITNTIIYIFYTIITLVVQLIQGIGLSLKPGDGSVLLHKLCKEQPITFL